MISGKPQAHTRAEGGDGGGPKAEAHAKRDKGGAHAMRQSSELDRQLTLGPTKGEEIALTHTRCGPMWGRYKQK